MLRCRHIQANYGITRSTKVSHSTQRPYGTDFMCRDTLETLVIRSPTLPLLHRDSIMAWTFPATIQTTTRDYPDLVQYRTPHHGGSAVAFIRVSLVSIDRMLFHGSPWRHTAWRILEGWEQPEWWLEASNPTMKRRNVNTALTVWLCRPIAKTFSFRTLTLSILF